MKKLKYIPKGYEIPFVIGDKEKFEKAWRIADGLKLDVRRDFIDSVIFFKEEIDKKLFLSHWK